MLYTRDILRIVGIYAVFGSLWIILSDTILQSILVDIDAVVNLSIVKGLLFITITSILLYVLIARQRVKVNDSLHALRETEERFQFLVENSSDSLVIINEDGRQRYVSHGSELLFGFTSSELEGKTIREVIHPDDIKSVMDAWRALVNGELQTVTVTYRHLHKDTSWVDCEAIARNFLHDPKVAGVLASVRDITERKKSEEALRQSNTFIRTILDNLPIGLAVNYINEGTATYMNRKFEEIYGWPKEELQDIESFFTRVYPDDDYRESIKNQVMEDIRSGDPERMQWTDIQINTRAGEKKSIKVQNIPLTEQGLMISTVQDITESKQLQQRMEQIQNLESIGRLAGGVAHDFNNLLTPILGYSDILLEGLHSQTENYRAVREIHNAGIRARDLVQQLLAFSRKQILQFSPLDINETIRSFENLLRRTIPEDIDIKAVLEPELPLVQGAAGQLEQVLMNLAVNAADAMPKGGALTLETQVVEIDRPHVRSRPGLDPGRYVMFTVNDSGCGMDEETVKNVFDPFFSTKGEYGTGLGLATVYGIVKQHGGNVYVDSVPGQGTTFAVYLPVSDEIVLRESEREQLAELQGEGTILIAEDDPQVRRLALRFLDKQGYTLLEAENGHEALVLATAFDGPIDLLLTDVVMPEMNGKELYQKMTEEYPGLKVLFMSGYTADVIAHRGVLEDDAWFIQKPFTRNNLLSKLKTLFGE